MEEEKLETDIFEEISNKISKKNNIFKFISNRRDKYII